MTGKTKSYSCETKTEFVLVVIVGVDDSISQLVGQQRHNITML